MIKINRSVIITICGIVLFTYPKIINHKEVSIEKNRISATIEKENGYNYENNRDIYDGIIEIPKINLIKGFYTIEDKRNNVNENVTVHYSSTYPNVENSNLILMAHSGRGEKAYFNDLVKLDEDSLIKIYYKGKKYTYKIATNYEINKTGNAVIQKNINKKSITLITCSQKDKTKQLVFIGYIIDET